MSAVRQIRHGKINTISYNERYISISMNIVNPNKVAIFINGSNDYVIDYISTTITKSYVRFNSSASFSPDFNFTYTIIEFY